MLASLFCSNMPTEKSNMEITIIIQWSLTTLFVLASLLLLRKFLKHPDNKLRLPPGPRKLPIIGNLHQLAAKNMTPHRALRELAREHGPIMHLRLGELPTVVLSSAEAARGALKTHDTQLANRPKLLAGKFIFYNHSDMALAPYGEYWRQLRKIATLELFTTKRIQSFRHIREDEASKLVKYLAMEADYGSPVDMSHQLFTLIFNITSRIVFQKEGEGQKTFRVLLTNLLDILAGFHIADLYPSIKWLDSITGLRRQLVGMAKECDRMLDPIIEEHISKKKQGKAEADLVDVLLAFHKDNCCDGDNHSFSLTNDNIKGIILEIFVAGSETTFAVIEWAMSELVGNPKLMERAQAEVRKVYQNRGKVDESSLNELKFLKLVIKETLRLHFVAPLLAPREAIEHCQILGYDVPPKTRVFVNAWAIARDPEYWTDPDLFKPERFEGSSIDYKGTNFEFIPFGAGRRMCPGLTLGLMNVELSLATLLYHFDWKLPTGIEPQNLDMDEMCGVTVRRKNPLLVIPIPYVSN